MKKISWMLTAILMCGSMAFVACSSDDDEKKMENLTMEVLKGLWVADYAESGTQGDKKWTRTVEAFQFSEDNTTYHESFQLNGEKLVKVTAIRDNATFSFSISGNTITITGTDDKTVAFTYADGKLTTPEGKVLQKATDEQKTFIDQLYGESSGGNSADNTVGYIECSWDGTKVVKTPRVVSKSYSIDLSTYETTNGKNYVVWDEGTYYLFGKLNIDAYLRIELGRKVNLILCDGCELRVKSIVVQGSNTKNKVSELCIFGQDNGTGRLIIDNPDPEFPGIGPHDESNARIEIHGGVITAKGAPGCAGIGGGYHDKGAGFNDIYIYDGTIDATGGDASAGIGNGDYAGGIGKIHIYGGNITAQGGGFIVGPSDWGGAGIGGSARFHVSGVYIYGGNIKATGGSDSAGIGAGESVANGMGEINICGGYIIAEGGKYGAGIGGGDGVQPGPITISGGTVYAYAGTNAAGIGGGEGGESGNITITGGTVRAYGDRWASGSSNSGYGSGIGSGQAASVNTIIIKGGDIEAYGGEDGAGIGTGEEYGSDIISGTIEIHGGKVFAQGKGYGAGIGAGEDATFGVLGISGGRVDAHAGSDCGPWSGGIGAYHSEHEDGCHIGWAGWQRIYIGAGMRLWTYSPNVGYIENVNTAGNQWWDFVHQRPQVAFGVCDHEGWAVCPLCYPYTIQLGGQ